MKAPSLIFVIPDKHGDLKEEEMEKYFIKYQQRMAE